MYIGGFCRHAVLPFRQDFDIETMDVLYSHPLCFWTTRRDLSPCNLTPIDGSCPPTTSQTLSQHILKWNHGSVVVRPKQTNCSLRRGSGNPATGSRRKARQHALADPKSTMRKAKCRQTIISMKSPLSNMSSCWGSITANDAMVSCRYDIIVHLTSC
jgi:hypothetical protein